MRVIDFDGQEVAVGEEGDIALRGDAPALFAGYWNAPEETAAVYRGEWYVTGDRAVRDEDGYLWFTGRADDVILSAAYRIGPFEVESALLEHPAVAESAVVGKPDPDRGQIVKAFVVLRPGHDGGDALAVELQEHCKRVTAPYKYPREIEFVGRAAEDAERQDPARGAAEAGGGAGTRLGGVGGRAGPRPTTGPGQHQPSRTVWASSSDVTIVPAASIQPTTKRFSPLTSPSRFESRVARRSCVIPTIPFFDESLCMRP